jgi:hypothetical protein
MESVNRLMIIKTFAPYLSNKSFTPNILRFRVFLSIVELRALLDRKRENHFSYFILKLAFPFDKSTPTRKNIVSHFCKLFRERFKKMPLILTNLNGKQFLQPWFSYVGLSYG